MALPNMEFVLDAMDRTPGFFPRNESHRLIETALRAMAESKPPYYIVEIGSYVGRTTIGLGHAARFVGKGAKVYAIDPHNGTLTEPLGGLIVGQPTLDGFKKSISDAGLWDVVELIHQKSYEVVWEKTICMIFIDGLHDYENVSRDYMHFERHLGLGAIVAFHDYTSAFPGVPQFVDELLGKGALRKLELVGNLMITQKCG